MAAFAVRLERLTYVAASPRAVWATLHDPAAQDALYPELRLGPAAPSWPAAGATRSARLRIGLLRVQVRLGSLEARPDARFRIVVVGDGIRLERGWRLEPAAGEGTKVAGSIALTLAGWPTRALVRLGRGSAEKLVEAHLRILKEMTEAGLDRTAGP